MSGLVNNWTQVYFRSSIKTATFTARKLVILYLLFKGGGGGRILLRYLCEDVSLGWLSPDAVYDSNSDCPTVKDFPTPAVNHKDCFTIFFTNP